MRGRNPNEMANADLKQAVKKLATAPYAWRFGNGRPRLWNIDTDGRVTNNWSPGVHSLSYGYDLGNLISGVTDGIVSAQSTAYGYDDARHAWPRPM